MAPKRGKESCVLKITQATAKKEKCVTENPDERRHLRGGRDDNLGKL